MRSHLGDPGFTMKTFRKTLHGTKKKNKTKKQPGIKEGLSEAAARNIG